MSVQGRAGAIVAPFARLTYHRPTNARFIVAPSLSREGAGSLFSVRLLFAALGARRRRTRAASPPIYRLGPGSRRPLDAVLPAVELAGPPRSPVVIALESKDDPLEDVDLLKVEPDRGFSLLPEPNPGDVWLDLEGHPWFEPARGLEYLNTDLPTASASEPEGEASR